MVQSSPQPRRSTMDYHHHSVVSSQLYEGGATGSDSTSKKSFTATFASIGSGSGDSNSSSKKGKVFIMNKAQQSATGSTSDSLTRMYDNGVEMIKWREEKCKKMKAELENRVL